MNTLVVLTLAALLLASPAGAEEAAAVPSPNPGDASAAPLASVPLEQSSGDVPAADSTSPPADSEPAAPSGSEGTTSGAAPTEAAGAAAAAPSQQAAPDASTPPAPAEQRPASPVPVEASSEPASAASTPVASVSAEPSAEPADGGWKNELSIEAGWNTPTGQGLRYLRRLGNSRWSVGAGVGYAARWGWKFSAQVRATGLLGSEGLFVQLAGSYLPGVERTVINVFDVAGNELLRPFQLTQAGTVDLGIGHRWVSGRGFFELICGYAFNVRGTALQLDRAVAARLSESTRSELALQAPGGIVAGAAAGVRF